MEESKKEEVEETTNQSDSTDENKDKNQEEDTSQNNEDSKEQEDEKVTLTKSELEKLQKKAKDFDGIIQKQKLEKFKKTEQKEKKDDSDNKETDEEKIARLAKEEVQKIFQQERAGTYEKNLGEALGDFLKENEWANNDGIIDKISENFSSDGAVSREDILVKLKNSARDNFPTEYEQSLEMKIKAKILAEKSNIDTGAGGGSSEPNNKVDTTNATAEDKRLADKYFGGDLERYLKHKRE